MDEERARIVAAALDEAERERRPISPVSETYHLDVPAAYEVQRATLALRLGRGEKLVGRKIGLTNKVMQQALGISEPDYGFLTDRMILPDGCAVPMDELVAPRVEGEVAFILDRELRGPGVNVASVLEATRGVMAVIEVVDSRIKDWKITIVDTVSDNAGAARVVVGGVLLPPHACDLRLAAMVMRKNGEVVATGAGAAVLGHPAASVAWLANVLARYGDHLRAGDIVLSGAMAGAVPVQRGDCVDVEITWLGRVGATFV